MKEGLMGNPNEALVDARGYARQVAEAIDGNGDLVDAAAALVGAFRQLDDHLNAGGYLPADWDRLTGQPYVPPWNTADACDHQGTTDGLQCSHCCPCGQCGAERAVPLVKAARAVLAAWERVTVDGELVGWGAVRDTIASAIERLREVTPR